MPHTTSHKKETSKHFEALFEYAMMGIIITDSSGKIGAVNPYALREFGYTEKELLGKEIEILIPGRFHEKHISHRQSYMQDPQNRPTAVGMDLFAIKKDGTEFPVEVSLANYNTNGDHFTIAFISNISERKKTEEEIKKLNDQLEATVKQRTSDSE